MWRVTRLDFASKTISKWEIFSSNRQRDERSMAVWDYMYYVEVGRRTGSTLMWPKVLSIWLRDSSKKMYCTVVGWIHAGGGFGISPWILELKSSDLFLKIQFPAHSAGILQKDNVSLSRSVYPLLHTRDLNSHSSLRYMYVRIPDDMSRPRFNSVCVHSAGNFQRDNLSFSRSVYPLLHTRDIISHSSLRYM